MYVLIQFQLQLHLQLLCTLRYELKLTNPVWLNLASIDTLEKC